MILLPVAMAIYRCSTHLGTRSLGQTGIAPTLCRYFMERDVTRFGQIAERVGQQPVEVRDQRLLVK